MFSHHKTVGELLDTTCALFEECGIDSPRLDAEVLLCHVLGQERPRLYLDLDRPVTGEQLLFFQTLVGRRLRREPLAYIIGTKEFWSLALHVNSKVLIPRPETELLVEEVLGILQPIDRHGRCTRILELGTGSGAISIALAKETDHAVIIATDRSRAALHVARQNIRLHGCDQRIHLACCDWAHLFAGRPLFDVIVANPPYIPTDQIETLAPEIKDYEPRQALDGGKDGLDFYRTWIPLFTGILRPGGWVALELGAGQAASVAECFNRSQRWTNIETVQDLLHIDRIILAQVQ